jgi:hypothetical protein
MPQKVDDQSLDLWTHLLLRADQSSPIRDEPERGT